MTTSTTREKGIWLLKAIDLWEVSLVTFPANDEARISDENPAGARRDRALPSKVERALREVGFSGSQARPSWPKATALLARVMRMLAPRSTPEIPD